MLVPVNKFNLTQNFLNKKFKQERQDKILNLRNFENFNLNLIEKKYKKFQKIYAISRKLNADKLFKYFNEYLNVFDLVKFENFSKENFIGERFPSKQNFLSIEINKIETLALLYFSQTLITSTSFYLELQISKELLMPSLIFTSSSHLIFSKKFLNPKENSRGVTLKKSSESTEQPEDYDNSKIEKFEELHFIEESNFKISIILLKLCNFFFMGTHKFEFCEAGKSQNYFLKFKKNSLDEIRFIHESMFEFGKIFKNTYKVKSSIFNKKIKDLNNPTKTLFPKFKLLSVSSNNCLNNFFFEEVKFFKSDIEFNSSTKISDKTTCSILISTNNLKKLDGILKAITFKNLHLKIFQIENIYNLAFEDLVELVWDLKSVHQRLILFVGDQNQIQLIRFVYTLSYLPKVHCLKIFSALKMFSEIENKILIIKKYFEKGFIVFPIYFFPRLNYLTKHVCPNFFEVNMKYVYQKKELVPIFGINSMAIFNEYKLDEQLRNPTWLLHAFTKIFYKEYQVNLLNRSFYYMHLLIFREVLLNYKTFRKKQFKKRFLFDIFLIFLYNKVMHKLK